MGKNKGGTVYNALSTASLVGLFLSVGILIVGVMRGTMGAGLVLTLSILTIIFGCCALSLVWVRSLERKRFVKTSIVFLAFTVICGALWIGAAISIYCMLTNPNTDKLGLWLNFLRISLVITMQFVFANIICRNIIRYKKTYLAFQIIFYISCLYVDFFLSLMSLSLKFYNNNIQLDNSTLEMLFSGPFLTCFIVAVVYVFISNQILDSIARKKGLKTGKGGMISSLFDDAEFEEDLKKAEEKKNTPVPPVVPAKKEDNSSVKERLAELKKLYNEGIITKEEYDAKRNDILEDI